MITTYVIYNVIVSMIDDSLARDYYSNIIPTVISSRNVTSHLYLIKLYTYGGDFQLIEFGDTYL